MFFVMYWAPVFIPKAANNDAGSCLLPVMATGASRTLTGQKACLASFVMFFHGLTASLQRP